jgi:phosphomannomutase
MHLVSPQESREKLLQKLSNVVLESKSDFGVIFDGHGEKLYIVDNHSELLSEFEMNKLLIELYKLNKIYGTVLLPTWYTDYFAEMSQDIRIERLKDRELFIASGKKSKVLHQVTPNSLYIFPGNSRFADALLHFYRLVSLLSPLRDIDINSLKKLDKIHILYKHIAVDESKRPFFLDEINAFLINKSSDGFFDRDYGLRASFDRRDWLFAKLDRETSSAHIWIEGRDEKAVQNSMKQLKEHLKQSKLIREQRNVG